jgi:hypothetical protein
MEPEDRPGWTEIIESLRKGLESHGPPGQGPCFYRRRKVKVENQTTVVASSSSSSSTRFLEMQQQGTRPVQSQALPIIWEKDFGFAKWEKISVWRELLQGHDIPNGEAALKALMPREVARALEDIATVEVNIASKSREVKAAWFAAMESWVPQTPAASEAWQEIKENFTIDDPKSFRSTCYGKVFYDWNEESPVEFNAWLKAVEEAWRQNTFLKTWRAAYFEIENLKRRVLGLRISPAVKVGSGWEADMNFMLLKDFNSLLERAKSEALEKAKRVQELFTEHSKSPPFFPTVDWPNLIQRSNLIFEDE